MPILNVDKARTVIVNKRSMNTGFAGIQNELFGYEIALCGMCSGVSFWTMAFPFDTAKSRLQTQRSTGSGVYNGVFDCICRVAKEEGFKALYKGYGVAVVRAALTGSSVFFTYEQIRSALG